MAGKLVQRQRACGQARAVQIPRLSDLPAYCIPYNRLAVWAGAGGLCMFDGRVLEHRGRGSVAHGTGGRVVGDFVFPAAGVARFHPPVYSASRARAAVVVLDQAPRLVG